MKKSVFEIIADGFDNVNYHQLHSLHRDDKLSVKLDALRDKVIRLVYDYKSGKCWDAPNLIKIGIFNFMKECKSEKVVNELAALNYTIQLALIDC